MNHIKTVVQLIGHGKGHPLGIEVTTPGWRGVDAAFRGPIKDQMPDDLKKIIAVLAQAKIKKWRTFFLADGATEFIIQDSKDFKAAISALTKSGWLSPVTRGAR